MKEITGRVVIDATNAVLGRLASYAAKQALLGKQVVIVNAEKAIIVGKKENIIKDYVEKLQRGRGWQKGPYWPRQAERLLRRTIRGMLPWKKARGREAYKLVKCYKGVPEEFKNSEMVRLKTKKYLDFLTLGEVEKLLRGGRA